MNPRERKLAGNPGLYQSFTSAVNIVRNSWAPWRDSGMKFSAAATPACIQVQTWLMKVPVAVFKSGGDSWHLSVVCVCVCVWSRNESSTKAQVGHAYSKLRFIQIQNQISISGVSLQKSGCSFFFHSVLFVQTTDDALSSCVNCSVCGWSAGRDSIFEVWTWTEHTTGRTEKCWRNSVFLATEKWKESFAFCLQGLKELFQLQYKVGYP